MELHTDRLVLREFVLDDWRALHAYQVHPDYLRFYAFDKVADVHSQRFAGMFVDYQRLQPRTKFQLAITLRASGELIGNVGVRAKSRDAVEAELGYELAPWQWGQGYATEAALAMVGWAFRERRFHRIWATCIADNVGSARVLEKVGMQREGRLRENEFFKGRWWDTLLYAILDREWAAQPGALQVHQG